MANHNELGKKGEEFAIDFLVKAGYKILEKNYRFQKAEVDIIALKGLVLAIVEVKTRSTDYFGNPQDFVNPKKIKPFRNREKHLLNALTFFSFSDE